MGFYKFMLLLTFVAYNMAYDINLFTRNLQLAASTYCDIEKWNCVHCIDDINIQKTIVAETNIIIGYDEVQEAQVVSFRGSSNIDNWISNIKVEFVTPYNNKDIRVHKGLYEEYLLYKTAVIESLNNTNVVISGHSSGAALGMFLAYDIHNVYNVTLYTYGKPRIGNIHFAESVSESNITHYRITHAHDIVPHLPEEIFGYVHTNTEFWFCDDTLKYIVCNDRESDKCSNSCAPIHCTSTKDHLYYLMTDIGSESCY
jgi:predicted lipase